MYSTEEKAIAACVRKDPAAQQWLFKKYYGSMLSLCIRYTGDRSTAEDVVQDGFITLFDKIHTYTHRGSFEGWVRRLFVNTALSYLRKNEALRRAENLEDTARHTAAAEDTARNLSAKELMELVASMPAGFRTVFNLYAIEGYSHQEIAQMMHINEGTSRSQYARARIWLQNKLQEHNR